MVSERSRASAILAMLMVGTMSIPHGVGGQPVSGVGPALDVSAGLDQTCFLLQIGNVYCQGANTEHDADGYVGGDAVGVSAGAHHTCFLLKQGSVQCIGANESGQSAPYASRIKDLFGQSKRADQVSAGFAHTCLRLIGGNALCQGDNSTGQIWNFTADSLWDAGAVAAGAWHSCFLLVSDLTGEPPGRVECHGLNTSGQSAPHTTLDVAAVSAGYAHTCFLLTNGDVTCQGDNSTGQTTGYKGHGKDQELSAIAVRAGYNDTCILLLGGNVTCSGDNTFGQADAYTGEDAIALGVGAGHRCIVHAAPLPRDIAGRSVDVGSGSCRGDNRGGRSEDYNAAGGVGPLTLEASDGSGPSDITLNLRGAGWLAPVTFELWRGQVPTHEDHFVTRASYGAPLTVDKEFQEHDLNDGTYFYVVREFSGTGKLTRQSNEASYTIRQTQDDANSGRDASDQLSFPTRLDIVGTPSSLSYFGQVYPILDTIDAYTLNVTTNGSGAHNLCVDLVPLHGDDLAIEIVSPNGVTKLVDSKGFGGAEHACPDPGNDGPGAYKVVVLESASAASTTRPAGSVAAELGLDNRQNYALVIGCDPWCLKSQG